MNFGDRIKQLRTQKNLTQPQLAQAVGIEQSYLSKLENDKSVPGADIFQSFLRVFQMDVAAFLEGVDDNVVHRELRQVPEVANHLNSQVSLRIHNAKRWLYGSAIAGVLGLTLFGAGYQQLLVSNWQYTYRSPGVIHPGEPTDLFDTIGRWLRLRVAAGQIDENQARKLEAELMAREQEDFLTVPERRGEGFLLKVPGGSRVYGLKDQSYQARPANRYLMFAGMLLAFASVFGFLVEMRLRSLKFRG
jgi:transcriptional regulator with XRE-family HTH domain